MTPIIPIPSESDMNSLLFQNKEVDNDSFFQTMEEGLSSIFSSIEIHQQTRLELKKFLVQIKNENRIKGLTEWTADEQEKFFEKVRMEVVNTGFMISAQIREKIEILIEDEVRREIGNAKQTMSLQDGDGNTMIADTGKYQNFLDTSFLLAKETSVIPLDLRLTISKTETIQDAKKKLDRYNGKYNALVFVDSENRPMGIVKRDILHKYENDGHSTLEGINYIPDLFGHYTTSSDRIKEVMQGNGINILPIIDSKTEILIGILTDTAIAKRELQYYSTTSLTELSLDYLKMST